MKRSFFRSPYLWAIVGVLGVVALAWVGRESYRPVITGTEAPDFTFASIDGEQVRLSRFEGEKVVLVNVWATWCGPCVVEMPSMQRLYDSLQGENFEILAVSVDAPSGDVDAFGRPGGDLRAFTEELSLTFPILHDPTNSISRLYQTTGVPESFIVGKDGVIYKKVAGPTEWDATQHEELIRRLLDAE
ncbi:MAG: TlpA family protein disulfide reductase [Gemmatimonadetes bacterium]|nr:TlpA family protein disulfide reductase [Gemmatimonadota bacterium]NNF12497.1 TlpA family protein disulfide reductase [Gemmatimonadota bacterium]NNL30244.1 TlpA family protein disulfide reductase [Gemmatimonadota bacterium]